MLPSTERTSTSAWVRISLIAVPGLAARRSSRAYQAISRGLRAASAASGTSRDPSPQVVLARSTNASRASRRIAQS